MAKVKSIIASDPVINEVERFLKRYEADHPGSNGTAYRHNSVSIRIRIIDPGFRRMDRVQRDDHVRRYLDELSDEAYQDLSVLLLLTEEELSTSFANTEFDHPVPSTL